ncbi:MAG: extracellular solute-binding protein [Firmicutes bacterium]|nr:extracellular solute-binding protein [Bacillota bacterium]
MKRKGMLSVALATAIAFSAIGCGGQPADTGTNGGSGKDSAKTENTSDGERVPIRWLTTGDAAAAAIQEGDRIIEAINEKLGIDLKVEIVPEGNVEKVNVAMASGDFPDVVTGSYGTSATQQWIDDGMVIPLNDYFDKLGNMKKWLEEDYSWTAIDGKYYGIPFITQYNAANTLIVMRQDWLENLGLSYPTTLEEMKDVMVAFTQDDPDGNGKDDTYGFTAEKPGGNTPFDWAFYAYGRKYADYALDENDQVIPVFEDPSFIPGMAYIKELWDLKVIDPELMLNDMAKKEEKFYQGKAGSMWAPLFRNISRHENSVKELYPDATLTYGLAPKGPDGSSGMSPQGKGGMMTCITTACKNQEKAAEFVDFMISEEGNNLLRLGIEGIHYTKDGDNIVFNEEERAKDSFASDGWAHALAWGSFYWPLESEYIPVSDPNREKALETVEIASACQVPNLIKQKTPMEIESLSALNDIYIQYFSDMLQGKISIEEGAKKLSESWRSQGGEELLKELNEVYHASK